MKLVKILDQLNSFEKNSFLKIIDNIIAEQPQNHKEVENILSGTDKDLKNVDNINISRVFSLIKREFHEYVFNEFTQTSSQLDILVDILIRDGNCIMSREWFDKLYERELKQLKKKLIEFKKLIQSDDNERDLRFRDYKIYSNCLYTAYHNDLENNQDCKVTTDEQSILMTLSEQLGLSQEENKLINYSILPLEKQDVDKIISDLKNKGIIFYSRKNHQVYVADEVVYILRKIRGKEVADKFYKRVLRHIKDSQLNMVCRKHNIDKKLPKSEKIKQIINEGISFSTLLQYDIYKEDVNLTERKNYLSNLIEKELKISLPVKGNTVNDKIKNLISHFENIEKDEKVGISINGYEKLLIDLSSHIKNLNDLIKLEFELQEENVLHANYLIDFNIKPRDILDLIKENDLSDFCTAKGIKTRGNKVVNVLESYKDTENIYLENFENIGLRNLNSLRENGIPLKESELGIKFEGLTKIIFTKLGFNVDEKLRRKLNTSKNKIDIVLNLGNDELIIIECKTIKESGYNKFSSVSRQIKSYIDLASKKNYKVIKSLLVAPEFSDDFIADCELEYELNLSLISAKALVGILKGFKETKLKNLPYNLLMRDVVIKEERILKAIVK